VIEANISIGSFNPFSTAPAVAWSADNRWLTLHGDTGIFRFDPQTGTLEKLPVEADYINKPFWSPDGRYLAFHSHHDNYTVDLLNIWDSKANNISTLPEQINTIIGWQGSNIQDSLLYCGEG
jgi:Tol biopolymer transport system component